MRFQGGPKRGPEGYGSLWGRADRSKFWGLGLPYNLRLHLRMITRLEGLEAQGLTRRGDGEFLGAESLFPDFCRCRKSFGRHFHQDLEVYVRNGPRKIDPSHFFVSMHLFLAAYD